MAKADLQVVEKRVPPAGSHHPAADQSAADAIGLKATACAHEPDAWLTSVWDSASSRVLEKDRLGKHE